MPVFSALLRLTTAVLGSSGSSSSSPLSHPAHGDPVHAQSLALKLEIVAIWLPAHPAQVQVVISPLSPRCCSLTGTHILIQIHWGTTTGKPEQAAQAPRNSSNQLSRTCLHLDGQDSNFTCLFPEHQDLPWLHQLCTKEVQAPFASANNVLFFQHRFYRSASYAQLVKAPAYPLLIVVLNLYPNLRVSSKRIIES